MEPLTPVRVWAGLLFFNYPNLNYLPILFIVEMTQELKEKQDHKVNPRRVNNQDGFVKEIQNIINEHPRLYKALAEDKFD